jgi:CPA1 family monovalent cation:H+ antiporter
MAVRFVWVIGHTVVGRAVASPGTAVVPWRSATAVAWCGMRGIVTLAAAIALPAGFPHRDFVLFCAFAVVLGTLVVQGGTLRPLMRLLRLEDDGSVDHEVDLARAETARAALQEMEASAPGEMITLLQRKYQSRLARSQRIAQHPAHFVDPIDDGATLYLETLRRAQEAERRTLFELRARGTIGDDAFHRVEEELDWAELNRESMARVG